jgi:predicted DNA-binding protein YlxM (UPF0122 family)|tara:strand:+ start:10749 stop:11123 length:375 start_codon:yes stop_codon:yes gene_type:complete
MTFTEKEKIKRLRAKGQTYQEIADTYHVTRQRIHQIVMEYKSKNGKYIPRKDLNPQEKKEKRKKYLSKYFKKEKWKKYRKQFRVKNRTRIKKYAKQYYSKNKWEISHKNNPTIKHNSKANCPYC